MLVAIIGTVGEWITRTTTTMMMTVMMMMTRCPEGSSASELSSYDECIEIALKGRGQKLQVNQNWSSSSSRFPSQEVIILIWLFQTQCTTDTLRNNDKLTVPLYTDHCSAICFTKVIVILMSMPMIMTLIVMVKMRSTKMKMTKNPFQGNTRGVHDCPYNGIRWVFVWKTWNILLISKTLILSLMQ